MRTRLTNTVLRVISHPGTAATLGAVIGTIVAIGMGLPPQETFLAGPGTSGGGGS